MEQNPNRVIADQQRLLQIFPEELWVQVAETLNPETFFSMIHTSPFFRRVNSSLITRLLFPKIIQPLHEASNSREVLLKTRQVCKTWNEGQDSYFRDSEEFLKFELFDPSEKATFTTQNGECSKLEIVQNLLYTYSFGTGYRNSLEAFMEKVENTHGALHNSKSPFVGNAIVLKYAISNGEVDELPNPFDRIITFLDNYGQFILHFTNVIEDNTRNCIAFYNIVRTILSKLPNLVSLSLQAVRSVGLDDKSCQLQEHTASHPLPHLIQLKFLSMKEIDIEVCIELLLQNPQIVCCEFRTTQGFEGLNFPLVNMQLPTLEKLSLQLCPTEPVHFFELLENPAAKWGTSSATLDFTLIPFLNWRHIFSAINAKFTSGIKKLVLLLPNPDSEEEEIQMRESCRFGAIMLPNTVWFRVSVNLSSALDFILPMSQTLKILFLDLNSDETKTMRFLAEGILKEYDLGNRVQFLSVYNDISSSNIWKLFPNLQQVYISQSYGQQRVFYRH